MMKSGQQSGHLSGVRSVSPLASMYRSSVPFLNLLSAFLFVKLLGVNKVDCNNHVLFHYNIAPAVCHSYLEEPLSYRYFAVLDRCTLWTK